MRFEGPRVERQFLFEVPNNLFDIEQLLPLANQYALIIVLLVINIFRAKLFSHLFIDVM